MNDRQRRGNAGKFEKLNSMAGISYALIGGSLWGISGTVSSVLFSQYGMPYLSLVTIRMLLPGLILVTILRPAFPKGDLKRFFLFSIFGLFGVQIFYLATIAYSNAPTATLLQYLFFPMVIAVEVAMKRIGFTLAIAISLLLAIVGTFELSTGYPSQTTGIILSEGALVLGLLSALTAAYYTLVTSTLIRKHGTMPVISWGFIVGGLISVPFSFAPTVVFFSRINIPEIAPVILLTVFVAFFGTIIAFGLYMKSMSRISATKASLAGTMEPISAALSSALFLGIFLTPLQYVGGSMIICAILVVQFFSKETGKS